MDSSAPMQAGSPDAAPTIEENAATATERPAVEVTSAGKRQLSASQEGSALHDAIASGFQDGGANQPTNASANMRRIIAEDPEWNLAPVERLTDICIKVIVDNFKDLPLIDGIPKKFRARILSGISTDLPLSITAPLIPDEQYWKKCAVEKFINCDPSRYNGSWKQLYFEKYAQCLIEAYVPNNRFQEEGKVDDIKPLPVPTLGGGKFGVNKNSNSMAPLTDTAAVRKVLGLGSPFIRSLDITQMRVHEKTEGVVVKATDPPPNHLDVKMILSTLDQLESISLYYGVRDCGIDFNWKMFGMTMQDCTNLCSGLRLKTVSSTLKTLKINSSNIDDDRTILIASSILENKTLATLDLSHNHIGDIGAKGLARVLASPETVLSSLILANNRIGINGVYAIGHALGKSSSDGKHILQAGKSDKQAALYGDNTSLHVLNLRLNRLGDEGGAELCELLLRNDTLRKLDLSANDLGKQSTAALTQLIKKNGTRLVSIDVSCNKLGSGSGAISSQTVEDSEQVATSGADDSPVSPLGADAPQVEHDAAGKSFFEAISHNKYLSNLDLRMTEIPTEYIGAIQGIIVE